MRSQPLVSYKRGYDVNKKIPNTKDTEVDNGGVKRIFAVPLVSGELEVEFQINENLTAFNAQFLC